MTHDSLWLWLHTSWLSHFFTVFNVLLLSFLLLLHLQCSDLKLLCPWSKDFLFWHPGWEANEAGAVFAFDERRMGSGRCWPEGFLCTWKESNFESDWAFLSRVLSVTFAFSKILQEGPWQDFPRPVQVLLSGNSWIVHPGNWPEWHSEGSFAKQVSKCIQAIASQTQKRKETAGKAKAIRFAKCPGGHNRTFNTGRRVLFFGHC